MRVEVVVPVWGDRVSHWRSTCLPALREEASEIGAHLVVYTDDVGATALCNEGIREFRPLAQSAVHGGLDRADQAHADALDRALAGDYAVAPLVAGHYVGRGTLAAALRRVSEGYRAAMALCVPTSSEPPHGCTAHQLSFWAAEHGLVGFWANREQVSHPGHYGWRAPSGAVLVRPIFLDPILVRPLRAHSPGRAVDHFMVEGYCADISRVAFLDTRDGCAVGVAPPSGVPGVYRPALTPSMATAQGVAEWMRRVTPSGINVMPMNLDFLAQRFWLGEPGADRLRIEMESDEDVGMVRACYRTDTEIAA